MSKAVTYKGYTIQPALRHLVDTGQWELNVFISWQAGEEEEKAIHFGGHHSSITPNPLHNGRAHLNLVRCGTSSVVHSR